MADPVQPEEVEDDDELMPEEQQMQSSLINSALRTNGPTAARPIYFCHQCNMETTVNSEMICSRCNSGFVEELRPSDESSSATALPSPMEAQPLMSEESSENPSRGPHHHHHGHSMFSISMGGSNGPTTRVYMYSPLRSGRRRQGPTGHGHNPLQGTTPFPFPLGPRTMGPHPLSNLLSQFFGGGAASIFGVPTNMHGNPGDYVWGAGGLDAIITQLLNNMEGSGPPPADQSKIDNLTKVKISQAQVDSKMQCFVCFDDFTLDEEVHILPCKHHYHEQCIKPWLKIHGTCPVCRKDLNGGDTSIQEYDTNIGDTLSTLETTEPMDESDTPGPSTSTEVQNTSRDNTQTDALNSSNRQLVDDEPESYRNLLSRQMADDDLE